MRVQIPPAIPIYCGVEQRLARRPHKANVAGSNPAPARIANSQPPRGAIWVMLMTKNFWVRFINMQPKKLIFYRGEAYELYL